MMDGVTLLFIWPEVTKELSNVPPYNVFGSRGEEALIFQDRYTPVGYHAPHNL